MGQKLAKKNSRVFDVRREIVPKFRNIRVGGGDWKVTLCSVQTATRPSSSHTLIALFQIGWKLWNEMVCFLFGRKMLFEATEISWYCLNNFEATFIRIPQRQALFHCYRDCPFKFQGFPRLFINIPYSFL